VVIAGYWLLVAAYPMLEPKRLFRGTNQAGPTIFWRIGPCLAMRVSGHHRWSFTFDFN
jgi:hypothetical protein